MSFDAGTVTGRIQLEDAFSGPLLKAMQRLAEASDKTKAHAKDVDTLRTSYNRLAGQLDPTTAKTQKYQQAVVILDNSLKHGLITQDAYNKNLALAHARFNDAAAGASKFGSSIGRDLASHVGTLVSVGAAIGLLKSITTQFIQANTESEQVQKKVATATERVGNVSGFTAKEISDLADELSALLGVDDELIASTLALGTKFNRLSEDSLTRLIKVSLNAAAAGEDLTSTFEKQAKIVNNPLRGLTLLNREGYAVAASQADLVKHLIKTNDIAGAQDVMLKILESQYGDTAAEIRDTMGGALQALSTNWENLLEKLGEDGTGPMRDALEQLNALILYMTDNVDEASLAWNNIVIALEKADVWFIKLAKHLGNLSLIAATISPGLGTLLFGAATKSDTSIAKIEEDIARRQAAVARILADQFGVLTDKRKASTAAASEQTEAERKLSDAQAKLQEQIRNTIDAIEDSIAGYIRQAEASAAYYRAYLRDGEEGLRLERTHQKVLEAVRIEQEKLDKLGTGLKLSPAQIDEIRRAITLTSEFDNELGLLKDEYKSFTAAIVQSSKAMRDWSEAGQQQAHEIQQQTDAVAGGIADISREIDIIRKTAGLEGLALDRVLGLESVEDGIENVISSVQRLAGESEKAFGVRLAAATEQARAALLNLANEDYAARVRLYVEEPFRQAFDSIQSSFLSTVNEMILTGEADWSGFWDGFKRLALEAIEEWLKRWITAQRIAQTEAARTGAIQAAAAAGGGQLGGVTGITGASSGAIGMTGGVSSASSAGAVAGQAAGSGWSAWGTYASYAFLAWVGLKIFEGWTKGKVSRGEASLFGGTSGNRKISAQMAEIMAQIEDELTEVLTQLNIGVEHLGNITIGMTSKGEIYVKTAVDAWGKFFATMAEAVEYAKVQAIKFAEFSSSTSALIRAAISGSRGEDLSSLGSDIDFARMLETQNLPDIAQQMQAIMSQTIANFRRAMDLFRNDLGALTTAVDSIFSNFINSLTGAYNSLMGIKEDPKAIWERNKQAYNLQRAIMIAQIALLYEEIKARIALYQTQRLLLGDLANAGGGANRQPPGSGQEDTTTRGDRPDKGGQVPGAPEFDNRNPTNDPTLRALLQILDSLARAMGNLPPEITGGMPRGAGGRGGRGGDRQSARDFVTDRRFELSLEGLSAYQRGLKEIDKQYADLFAQAGKDKQLRADLMQLKEQELALLAKEQAESTVKRFREFLGLVTQFDQVRETAAALIKDIEGSPFGDARKAAMIGRVMADLDKQLERMSKQEAVSLFGEMIGKLEQFGVEGSELLEARKAAAIIEHTLNMENWRLRIEALKLEGKMAPALIKVLEDALGKLGKIDPTTILGGSGAGSSVSGPNYDDGTWMWTGAGWVKKAGTETDTSMDRARDLLKQYQDAGLDPLTRELNKITEDFALISRSLGNTAEVVSAKNAAIKRAIDDFLEPIRDFRSRMDVGELSTLTGEQQFKSIQSQFRDLPMTLQNRDKFLELADLYRELGREATAGEGYRFIDKEIRDALTRFESTIPQTAAAQLGASATNPMTVSAPSLQQAVVNGNTMIVTELRNQSGSLISMDDRLASMENQLANPLSVRNIA